MADRVRFIMDKMAPLLNQLQNLEICTVVSVSFIATLKSF